MKRDVRMIALPCLLAGLIAIQLTPGAAAQKDRAAEASRAGRSRQWRPSAVEVVEPMREDEVASPAGQSDARSAVPPPFLPTLSPTVYRALKSAASFALRAPQADSIFELETIMRQSS